MVSSLENWDGSLSSTVKQNGSRLTDLAESAEAFISHKKTTVPDERSSTLGNGHGVYERMTSLNMNHTVCCLFDGVRVMTQVAVYLERRVKCVWAPIA